PTEVPEATVRGFGRSRSPTGSVCRSRSTLMLRLAAPGARGPLRLSAGRGLRPHPSLALPTRKKGAPTAHGPRLRRRQAAPPGRPGYRFGDNSLYRPRRSVAFSAWELTQEMGNVKA